MIIYDIQFLLALHETHTIYLDFLRTSHISL